MSLNTVRTALVAKLDAVTGIENVYDYVYWTDDWQAIYSQFAKNGRINTWMVGLGSNVGNRVERGLVYKPYIFNLFAYYSLKTSNQSSKVFENLCDSVVNEFLVSRSFLAKTTINIASLVSVENGVFSGTPIHRAQLQIGVTEIVEQSFLCNG